jgi:hypothetical protein
MRHALVLLLDKECLKNKKRTFRNFHSQGLAPRLLN